MEPLNLDMFSKSPFASKTLWFNLIAMVVVAVIQAVQGGELPAELANYAPYILVALNIVLRVVTKQPLDFSIFKVKDNDGPDDPSSGGGVLPFGPIAALLACSLFAGTTTFAANPHAMIIGPTAAVPGDKILLDAGKSLDAKTYRWEVRNRNRDDRLGYNIHENGRVLEIFSYPGVYEVTLAVANEESIDLARWTVTVYATIPFGPEPPRPTPNPEPGPQPGPEPQPPQPPEPEPPRPPDPQPEPDPEPELPEGEFDIARSAHAAAGKVVSPRRVAEAHKIAESFDAIAAAISAGTLSGVRNIVTEMRTRNQQTLGDQIANWASFDEWFATQLTTLYQAGRLANDKQWATLLTEVALGLRAVQ